MTHFSTGSEPPPSPTASYLLLGLQIHPPTYYPPPLMHLAQCWGMPLHPIQFQLPPTSLHPPLRLPSCSSEPVVGRNAFQQDHTRTWVSHVLAEQRSSLLAQPAKEETTDHLSCRVLHLLAFCSDSPPCYPTASSSPRGGEHRWEKSHPPVDPPLGEQRCRWKRRRRKYDVYWRQNLK